VDLRLRFGLGATGYSERTCIIVVEIKGQAGNVLIGNMVNSVSEESKPVAEATKKYADPWEIEREGKRWVTTHA